MLFNYPQVSVPRLKAMTCDKVNQRQDSAEHIAVINLKVHGITLSLTYNTRNSRYCYLPIYCAFHYAAIDDH